MEIEQWSEESQALELVGEIVFEGEDPTHWVLEERFVHEQNACYRQDGTDVYVHPVGPESCAEEPIVSQASRNEAGEIVPAAFTEFVYFSKETITSRHGGEIPHPAEEYRSASGQQGTKAYEVSGTCRGGPTCNEDPKSDRVERWVFDPALETVVFYDARERGTIVERVRAVEVVTPTD